VKRATRRALQNLHLKASEDLAQMLRVCEEEHKDIIAEMILFYDATMKRNAKEEPASLAWGLHDAIDKSVQDTMRTNPRAVDVKCRQGCANCCHMVVAVTIGEARLLAEHAKEKGVAIDLDRLGRQAGRDVVQWRDLADEDKTCVFLKDGSCSVYEHRPAACRKLLVVTDPELCDTVKHPGAEVGRLATVDAEVIFSVMLTRQKSGLMADMLLEAML
jgi:Fe-S-cluster containining protein